MNSNYLLIVLVCFFVSCNSKKETVIEKHTEANSWYEMKLDRIYKSNCSRSERIHLIDDLFSLNKHRRSLAESYLDQYGSDVSKIEYLEHLLAMSHSEKRSYNKKQFQELIDSQQTMMCKADADKLLKQEREKRIIEENIRFKNEKIKVLQQEKELFQKKQKEK